MRVLVGCERSGVVREAFRRRGHDAVSCDLVASELPGPHAVGDVRELLGEGWDMLVAFPPCTYLSLAGAQYWPGRREEQDAAVRFVGELWNSPIARVAIENPVGKLWAAWRKPDQVVEPWWFGAPFFKRTCLWLRGLPPLMATVIETRRDAWVQGGKPGSPNSKGVARSAIAKSRTFLAVAEAMAEQWGGP